MQPRSIDPNTSPRICQPNLRLLSLILCSVLALAGCTGERPATALVHRLDSAPVPPGAVRISATHATGNAEIGPRASLEYSLPSPLPGACRDLLRRYLDAGYAVRQFSESQPPVGDPARRCAAEQARTRPGDVVALVVTVYPPGVSPRYPADGFAAVLTEPISGDHYPAGSHLRLSAP